MHRHELLHHYGIPHHLYKAPQPWERALQQEGRNPQHDLLSAIDEKRINTFPVDIQNFLRSQMPRITDDIQKGVLAMKSGTEVIPDALTHAGLSALTYARAKGYQGPLISWEEWYVNEDQECNHKPERDLGILRTIHQEEIAAHFIADGIVPKRLLQTLAKLDPRFSLWEEEIYKTGKKMIGAPNKMRLSYLIGSVADGYIFNSTADNDRILKLIIEQQAMIFPESLLRASAQEYIHEIYRLRRGLMQDISSFHQKHRLTNNISSIFEEIFTTAEKKFEQRLISCGLPATLIGVSIGIGVAEMQKTGPLNGLATTLITGSFLKAGSLTIDFFTEKWLKDFGAQYGLSHAQIRKITSEIEPFQEAKGEIAINKETEQKNSELKVKIWWKNFLSDLLIKGIPKQSTWFAVLATALFSQTKGLSAAMMIGNQRYASLLRERITKYGTYVASIEHTRIAVESLLIELNGRISMGRLPLQDHLESVDDPVISEFPLAIESLIIPPIKPGELNIHMKNLHVNMPASSFLTITGQNGTGKTSILHTLRGDFSAGNANQRVGVITSNGPQDLRTVPIQERQHLFPLIQLDKKSNIRSKLGVLLSGYSNKFGATESDMIKWTSDDDSRSDFTTQLVAHYHSVGFMDVTADWFTASIELSTAQRDMLMYLGSLAINDGNITLLWDEPFSSFSEENRGTMATIFQNLPNHFKGRIILTANEFPDAITSLPHSCGEYVTDTMTFEPHNHRKGYKDYNKIATIRTTIKNLLESYRTDSSMKYLEFRLFDLQDFLENYRNKSIVVDLVWNILKTKFSDNDTKIVFPRYLDDLAIYSGLNYITTLTSLISYANEQKIREILSDFQTDPNVKKFGNTLIQYIQLFQNSSIDSSRLETFNIISSFLNLFITIVTANPDIQDQLQIETNCQLLELGRLQTISGNIDNRLRVLNRILSNND
ncbi:MAG: ATP-binding cassette domain-containing protein [Candidatus Roizmanbacteria bacterium]